MPTEEKQQDGQTLTVTYRIGMNISNDQARELIQGNSPDGFDVQNVELSESENDNQ